MGMLHMKTAHCIYSTGVIGHHSRSFCSRGENKILARGENRNTNPRSTIRSLVSVTIGLLD
jgi:hypothetical protein